MTNIVWNTGHPKHDNDVLVIKEDAAGNRKVGVAFYWDNAWYGVNAQKWKVAAWAELPAPPGEEDAAEQEEEKRVEDELVRAALTLRKHCGDRADCGGCLFVDRHWCGINSPVSWYGEMFSREEAK